MALVPGAPVTGYLAARDDVDLFVFEGDSGRYRVAISGADEVPLRWRTGTGGEEHSDRRAAVALAPGDVIRLERGDRGGPKPAPGRDQPYTIDVVPAPRAGR